jgi:cytochrome c-type biogenesis protein CcmH
MPRASTSGPRDRPLGKRGRRDRGGVRTSIVSLATLAALIVLVVVTLVKSLTPPENAASPTTDRMADAAARAPGQDVTAIRGTITLAPDLAGRMRDGSVLFIVARKAAGPPFAVKRIAAPRFPLVYRIGAEDVMMAGEAFGGEVRVSARVSQTGIAGPAQPGDLEGEHGTSVQVGARNVDVVIARVR